MAPPLLHADAWRSLHVPSHGGVAGHPDDTCFRVQGLGFAGLLSWSDCLGAVHPVMIDADIYDGI